MRENYINFKGVTKVYPGSRALSNVSFSVARGEVHALLGENGAGKSTLLNILHGITKVSSGAIEIGGEELTYSNSAEAIQHGIIKVHQEISLVPEQSVSQNIMLGAEPRKGPFVNYSRMNNETNKLLEKLKCNFKATDKVATLSTGEMQMLQIAKALHIKASVISLDEPTASLGKNEVETLFEIIEELRSQGITIIYISHRLEEIFQIADKVTILRDGNHIHTGKLSEIKKDELIKKMVGREVSSFAQRLKPSQVKDETVLEVQKFSKKGVFNNIDIKLKKGEILGLFGLIGAKRTDFMRAIYGADKFTSGSLLINGGLVSNGQPSQSVRNGIGLIPEDRKAYGFVKDLNNVQNITISSLRMYCNQGIINERKRFQHALKVASSVSLQPMNLNFNTVNLSGGNQQKVVLAKWLAADIDIFIFDEPTRGIDVGAKSEIYKLMEDLVERGKSIIMVSSELPEVIGMSDRIIVMHKGRVSEEFLRKDFSEEKLMIAALGDY